MRSPCASIVALFLASFALAEVDRDLKGDLFRAYDEAWNAAASGRSYVHSLETECIKRGGSEGKKSKSYGRESGGKKSKSKSSNGRESSGKGDKGGKGKRRMLRQVDSVSSVGSRQLPTEFDRQGSELPFCDELEGGNEGDVPTPSGPQPPTGDREGQPPSAPVFSPPVPSPVFVPTVPSPVAPPTGENEGGMPTNGGSPSVPTVDGGQPSATTPTTEGGQVPTVDGTGGTPSGGVPTVDGQPTTEGGDVTNTVEPGGDGTNVTSPVVGDSEKCIAFFSGNAPNNTDTLPFSATMTLVTDGSRETRDIMQDMLVLLKEEVAPDILGCSRLSGQRRLDDSGPTELVNAQFPAIEETEDGVKTDGAVYFLGSFPQDILVTLFLAIKNADWARIDGLEGILGLVVEDGVGNTYSENEDPDPDGANSANRDIETDNGRSGLRAGGYVGLAAAGVVLGLALLFLGRRRRAPSDNQSRAMKHRQFRDDDSDSEYGPRRAPTILLNHSTDDSEDAYESNVARRQDPALTSARVVDDSSVWEDKHGQRFSVEIDEAPADELIHDGHSCSSPNCAVCRDRIDFVSPGEPPRRDVLPSDSARKYVTSDTVAL